MTKVKRIKDNISDKDFKHLITYLKADSNIREQRKDRLLKLFNILYLTGLRVNESNQLTNNKIYELLTTNKTKIIAHKQKSEKLIHITDKGIKTLKEYFTPTQNNDYIFTSERGNKNKPLNTQSTILDINSYLKKVFTNKNITSHSFRQTIITQLAEKNINTKIIQSFIGHKDIKSTYRYIKPSLDSITNSLELVR